MSRSMSASLLSGRTSLSTGNGVFSVVRKLLLGRYDDVVAIEHYALEESRTKRTLISRQFHIVCPCAAIAYITLQLLIGLKSGMADPSIPPFATGTVYFYYSAGFSFFMYALQTTGKIYECLMHSVDRNSLGIYCCAVTESLIASSSALLTAYYGYGGVFKNILGSESICSQWAEWMISVPLLLYMSVSIEDKPNLTRRDIAIIVCSNMCVVCGFLINFHIPFGMGVALFVLGAMCLMTSMVLGVFPERRSRSSTTPGYENLADHREYLEEDSKFIAQSVKRQTLSRIIIIVMPAFPLIEILKMTGAFTRDQGFVADELAGVVAKLLFLSTLADAHISLVQTINLLRLAAEEAANNTRRTFLRFVFDEVRVPLSTVSMGITVVKDDFSSRQWTQHSAEVLSYMKAANSSMSEALDDVLLMHRIEEGSMTLNKSPFDIADLIDSSLNFVKDTADSKGCAIMVEHNCVYSDKWVVGDRLRLEQALSNFLLNAIKYSPNSAQILMKINIQEYVLTNSHLSSGRFRYSTVSRYMNGVMSFLGFGGTGVAPEEDLVGNPVRVNISSNNRRQDEGQDQGRGGKKSRVANGTIYREVTVLVVDKGAGFSKMDVEGLFTPYGAIRPEALRDGRGTGVGLAVAKEIVLMHGGRVVKESEEGKGSAFGFTIPFEAAEKPSSMEISQSYRVISMKEDGLRPAAEVKSSNNNSNNNNTSNNRSGGAKESPNHKTTGSSGNDSKERPPMKRVLLGAGVESDSRVLAMLLRKHGVECDVVYSGAELVSTAREADMKNLYDLIIVDHIIANKNGEVVSSLRNQGFNKLIIGLSAGNTNEEAAALLDAGADCVINKQLHAAQVDAIEKFVRVRREASAGSGTNHISSSGKYIVDKKSRKDYVMRRL